MPKSSAVKKPAPSVDEADRRFLPVARAFAQTPGFSLMESKSGATRGLMWNGRSFGMSSHGRFLLKLTEERAAALIAEGIAQPFQPSAGRIMKSWIEVTDPKADWVALAKLAHGFAVAGATPALEGKKPATKAKSGSKATKAAAKKPVAKKPAAKTLAVTKAVAKKPAAKEPAPNKPVAKKLAPNKPVAKKPKR